jgi:hypothetical protein
MLTCSAGDYAKNRKRELTSYRFHEIGYSGGNIRDLLKKSRELAFIKNCEVIVEVRYSLSEHLVVVAGTGLELLTEAEVKAGEEG